MPLVKKLAIANRGEIASRIVDVCEEMGMKSVLLFAAGDEKSQAFRKAGERICIGDKGVLSYLDIEKNVEAAKAAGAQALHPGYGFLSESADFAKACLKKGILFVGPSTQSLLFFSNKLEAKKRAKKHMPVLESIPFKEEKGFLEKIKPLYPVMIKAASGGGGRGLRRARNEEGV